ncbi:hypothetical protein FOCC_FOCC011034 [Frankliniella occidentalis]|nr:hypothetical protein FOCC_FOCC011034 [Frankliniella occidentalis]
MQLRVFRGVCVTDERFFVVTSRSPLASVPDTVCVPSSPVHVDVSSCPVPSTPTTRRPPDPETTTKSGHRLQKYRSEWEQKFKWMTPVEDPYRAKCKLCGGEMRADMYMIGRHESTNTHTEWQKASTSRTSITSYIDRPNTPLAPKVQNAELTISGFLAAHNIAFRAVEHLVPLLKNCYPDSQVCQKMTLGRTKATGILLNVIGQAEKDFMTSVLKTTKFSIMMDESTDISSTKTACIDVRLYSKSGGKIISWFWDLVQVFSDNGAEVGATAERLYRLVMDTFVEVPKENIVGFGSDGCRVMMGEHNSMASRL